MIMPTSNTHKLWVESVISRLSIIIEVKDKYSRQKEWLSISTTKKKKERKISISNK